MKSGWTNVKTAQEYLDQRSKLATSGCIEFTGSLDSKGYGRVGNTRWGKTYGTRGAHRLSYILKHGPISSSSLFVCHKCDNPKCINTEHLFLGTAADNAKDRDTKGRGKASWVGKRKTGVDHPSAKLDPTKVRYIREHFKPELRNGGDIARKFGCTVGAVSYAYYRKTWKDVD